VENPKRASKSWWEEYLHVIPENQVLVGNHQSKSGQFPRAASPVMMGRGCLCATLDCRETTSTTHRELRELTRVSKNWRKELFFVFSMYLQSPLVQISATPHSRTSIAVWWRTSASCLARLRECPMPTVARRPTPPLPSQAPAPAPAAETTRATVRLWWPFVLNFFFFPFVLCNPKP
jgi:hypothetical protein